MFNLGQNNLLGMNESDIKIHLIKDRENYEEKLSKLMIFKGSKTFDSFISHYESLIEIQLKEREVYNQKLDLKNKDTNSLSMC